MRYCVFLLLSICFLYLPAQPAENSYGTKKNASFPFQLKAGLDHKITLYNQLFARFPSRDQKLKYVDVYRSKALSNNNKDHWLFSLFLESETHLSFSSTSNMEAILNGYHRLRYHAEQSNNGEYLFLAHTGIFHTHRRIKDKDSTAFYLKKSQDAFPKQKNALFKSLYHRRYALLKIEEEAYSEALNHLIQIDTAKAVKNTFVHCKALQSIGWIYEHLSYPERSKIYYSKAKDIAEKLDFEDLANFYKLKEAHIDLINLENPEKALRGYWKLKPFYTERGDYTEGIIYSTIGFSHLKLKNYDSVYPYLKKGMDFFEKTKDSTFLCIPYVYLTHYFNGIDKPSEAVAAGEKALFVIKAKNLPDYRKVLLLDQLSYAYKTLGQEERAYSLLRELNQIKIKLELKKNQVAFIENQYVLEKNKESLEIAELKNQVLKKTRTNYILLSLGLALLLVGLFFSNQNRKKVLVKLKEVDALKTTFYNNIAHELRTPLTVISGLANNLSNTVKKETKKSALTIKRNASELNNLVNQLLDLSKLEAGRLQINSVRGELSVYLKYLLQSFEPLAKAKEIRLHFLEETPNLVVDFDSEKIKYIINNLVSNALKNTAVGGDIYVQVASDKDTITLQVTDNGPGIPLEEQQNIFKRYHQGKGQTGGFGIGLSFTKELVSLMQGTISLVSSPGKGATFKVTLPKTENAETSTMAWELHGKTDMVVPKPSNPEKGGWQEKPLVHIIEDNLDIAQYLQSVLHLNFQLKLSYDGISGVENIFKDIPDIIITDVMMPKKNGYEVCQEVRNNEMTNHIPIVMLTAKSDIPSKIEGLKAGADAYIAKPFNELELITQMETLLATRKQLRAIYQNHTSLEEFQGMENPDRKFMEKIEKVMEAHLSNSNFGVKELCRELGVSRTHLHRKLKAITGLSTTQIMERHRLFRARILLQTTDFNISEVAYEIGFSDPAYFSRQYAKHFGHPPSETRN